MCPRPRSYEPRAEPAYRRRLENSHRSASKQPALGAYGHGGAYRTYAQVDPAKDMFTVLLYQRTNGGGDMADEITAFLTLAAAAVAE